MPSYWSTADFPACRTNQKQNLSNLNHILEKKEVLTETVESNADDDLSLILSVVEGSWPKADLTLFPHPLAKSATPWAAPDIKLEPLSLAFLVSFSDSVKMKIIFINVSQFWLISYFKFIEIEKRIMLQVIILYK
jgi:hypothetical protein